MANPKPGLLWMGSRPSYFVGGIRVKPVPSQKAMSGNQPYPPPSTNAKPPSILLQPLVLAQSIRKSTICDPNPLRRRDGFTLRQCTVNVFADSCSNGMASELSNISGVVRLSGLESSPKEEFSSSVLQLVSLLLIAPIEEATGAMMPKTPSSCPSLPKKRRSCQQLHCLEFPGCHLSATSQ